MIEELEKVGMTKNEAKVYLALLETGLTTSKLIIQKTSLHRQIVYDTLNFLIEKGLVSFIIQSNRKCFKAASPNTIFNYFNEKQKKIEEQKNAFEKVFPTLLEISSRLKDEREATVYSGNKGIKSLLDDMIKENKEINIIGASDIKAESFNYNLKFNIPKFDKERTKEKIQYKIILSEDLRFRAKEINKMKYSEARVLPKEFTSNSSVNIYGDKVSIILWGFQPFGVLIKSKDISGSQKKHFNILWKIAKKVK